MELAEKGVNKLKEGSPIEAAVDLVGTGAKYKKSKVETKEEDTKAINRERERTIHNRQIAPSFQNITIIIAISARIPRLTILYVSGVDRLTTQATVPFLGQ